jgi:type II secretion system protein H
MAITILYPMVPIKSKAGRVKMPTLPTSRKSQGFTLVEILVVLTMMGLLAAMAIPLYSKAQSRMRMWSDSRALIIDLRRAHSEAQNEQKMIVVTFSPEQRNYDFDGHKHPLNVDMGVTHEEIGRLPKDLVPAIRFYADGSASPAAITLSDGKRLTHIHIDGLTGLVDTDAD